jgi:hypothetical protein
MAGLTIRKNMQNNLPIDPEQVYQDLLKSGEISPGVITDGLCDTPEHQLEFDAQQKGKPPLVEDSVQ